MRIETIGLATLYLGDCREVLPELRAHACVTDPPYGVELGSTTGSGGAHGLALEAHASYADTYENYVQQIVPALTLAMQQSERAAVFIGPTFTNCRSLTRWAACIALLATARHQWGLRTSCRCFCTAPTRTCRTAPAADRVCKQRDS